jgi:hypothetical protein
MSDIGSIDTMLNIAESGHASSHASTTSLVSAVEFLRSVFAW